MQLTRCTPRHGFSTHSVAFLLVVSLLALMVRTDLSADAGDVKFANGLHLLTCKITGRVFEGESLWVEGKRTGLGMQWGKDGKLLQCGRWADDKLVESCPVPRSKIPVGKFLSDAGERHAGGTVTRFAIVRLVP